MQLKTILNQVTNYKSFVFGKVTWVENADQLALEVAIQPRANGRPVCSGCGRRQPGYDTMAEPRRFEFVPLWGIMVYFLYHMRRVNCPQCGVTRAMRSKIEPMKKVARSFREKRELILNWFRAKGQISAAIVEGFNNKLKLVTRKSYGFRTQTAYETALYHNLGALPERQLAHEFL